MHPTLPTVVLHRRDFDAVIFNLDGVVTRTATTHAAAWKRMFDAVLRRRADAEGRPYLPFDIDTDYREYVDGKPRYAGVESFLASRSIELPYGSPDDPPERSTVCGLGNRKNALFLELVREGGVEVYPSSVTLLHTLRAAGFATAVVSSSANTETILEAAGLRALFDAKVDGVDLGRLVLRGKPAPDAFLRACYDVGAEPPRAVVVEDAVSGVQAGREGRFGLVIGVDRIERPELLARAGAHVVVRDMDEVAVVA